MPSENVCKKDAKEVIGNLSFFETTGFSMWPFIRQSDKLIVKKCLVTDLRRGDVILYSFDNKLICHRLIKKINNRDGFSLFVRGDNSGWKYELISEDMVMGKAVALIRNSYVITFTSPLSIFINRCIVFVSPFLNCLVSVLKPWYNVGRKILLKS